MMKASAARRVRFSPTPSTRCSLGLARTALLTNLLAEGLGLETLLTSDDLVAAEGALTPDSPLMEDLAWLGLSWTVTPWSSAHLTPLAQSGRARIYAEAAGQLLLTGAAYRCACPPRARPGTGPCPCRDSPVCNGRTIRFRREYKSGLQYTDFASGARRRVGQANADDPVLVRPDQVPTAWLTYPADDIAYGITLPIFDRGRAGIETYIAISSALGGYTDLVIDLGRILVGDQQARRDLRTLRRDGVTANSVRKTLLASLFGSWPSWMPTDPASAGQWCDWARLRATVTTLDTGTLKPPRPPARPPKFQERDICRTAPADDVFADIDRALGLSPLRWSAGHLRHCLITLATRAAHLRHRATAPGRTVSRIADAPNTPARAELAEAYGLLVTEGDPIEVVNRLIAVTNSLAFEMEVDLPQIEILDYVRSCIVERRLLENGRFSAYHAALTASRPREIRVFLDGTARRPLFVEPGANEQAVLAALVRRGDLRALPADSDSVVVKPGQLVSVDRRQRARRANGRL